MEKANLLRYPYDAKDLVRMLKPYFGNTHTSGYIGLAIHILTIYDIWIKAAAKWT